MSRYKLTFDNDTQIIENKIIMIKRTLLYPSESGVCHVRRMYFIKFT